MLNQELFLESTGYVTQKELPAPKQCSYINPIRGGLNVIFKSLQWINQWSGVALSRKLEWFTQSHFILSSYRDTRKTLNKSWWVTLTGGGGDSFRLVMFVVVEICTLLSRPSHHQAERISSVNFRPSIHSQPQHQITNNAIMMESDLKRCTLHTDCTENTFQLSNT